MVVYMDVDVDVDVAALQLNALREATADSARRREEAAAGGSERQLEAAGGSRKPTQTACHRKNVWRAQLTC